MIFGKKKQKPENNDVIKAARGGPQAERSLPESLKNVRNIIAIGSGKGGVGKSTITTNLAVALAQLGAKVAVMDADVYGPSQPGMLGAKGKKLNTNSDHLRPMEKNGVGFISLGLIIPDDGPVVWRAPMAMQVLQQFIANIDWGDLDYLLIDMPPGTGDVQLTLAQQAGLTGSIVVTTPQNVALDIAKKGLRMFQEVKVPILGVVENMAGYVCDGCGHKNHIFKKGGGPRMAIDFDVPFLGSIPLDSEIVTSGDEGIPVVIQSKDSESSKAFLNLAKIFESEVAQLNGAENSDEPKKIGISAKMGITVEWGDGKKSDYSAYHLRVNCACAACVNENTGERTLDPKRVPLDIKAMKVQRVGRYGLMVEFSDGHNTGIYTYKRLKELGEAKPEKEQESFSV